MSVTGHGSFLRRLPECPLGQPSHCVAGLGAATGLFGSGVFLGRRACARACAAPPSRDGQTLGEKATRHTRGCARRADARRDVFRRGLLPLYGGCALESREMPAARPCCSTRRPGCKQNRVKARCGRKSAAPCGAESSKSQISSSRLQRTLNSQLSKSRQCGLTAVPARSRRSSSPGGLRAALPGVGWRCRSGRSPRRR
jgi:hypothetical protein